MKLGTNWRVIVRKAWSFRLGAVAALLSGAEVIVPLFADAMPRGAFAVLSFVTVVAAMVARLIAQPKAGL